MKNLETMIIDTIKYFITEGPVIFYTDYFIRGAVFINEICPDDRKVEEVYEETNKCLAKFRAGVIDEKELVIELIKFNLIRTMKEYEEDDNDIKQLKMEYLISVFQTITINIAGMLKLINEMICTKKVSEDTVERLEKYIYYTASRHLTCYVDKQKAMKKGESKIWQTK